MGKMGSGYGSECHLLRYLGRHRHLLEERILAEIGGEAISWLDSHFDCSAKWKDAERKGLDFLESVPSIQSTWSSFWPQKGGIQNWDAVARVQVSGNGEWLLVEAKANVEEMQSACGAKLGGKGHRQISESLAKVKADLGVPEERDWLSGYYQYANRLAALYFLVSQGIGARLLFIYFLGDQVPGKTCPKSQAEWEDALKAQERAIGLPARHMLSDRIHKLFLPVCC